MLSTEPNGIALEIQAVDLGDGRLNSRLAQLLASAAAAPSGCVSAVFEKGATREAAYRFLENRRVDADRILDAVARATLRRCTGDVVIVVLDQTSISVEDLGNIRGLGPVGTGSTRRRGIEVMTGLALDGEHRVIGLIAQTWRVRDDKLSPTGFDARGGHEKESALWLDVILSSLKRIRAEKPNARITFIGDRGSDIAGVFRAAAELNFDVVIRSAQDRVETDGTHLHRNMQRAPIVGAVERQVRVRNDRGEVKTKLKQLTLRVASVELDLRNVHRSRGTQHMNALQVEGGRGSERICWRLLTTKPLTTLADAVALVDEYCSRWRIEDFHRAWKRGCCDVESVLLRSVAAIVRWGTILAIVAARVERLKALSRAEPDRPARDELSEDEIRALQLISGEKKHRPDDWTKITLGQAAILIAYLGGWGGRSQGPAGATILGRGLERVEAAAAVVKAMRDDVD
jgi:hypothetical protein